MTTEEESPIRTSGRRLGKGIAIIAVIMALGAVINLGFGDFWHSYPPLGTLEVEEEKGPGEVVRTGVKHTFELTFVESSDFRTLGFNAVAGEPGANPEFEVNVGDEVTFKVKNGGKMPHAFGVVTDPNDPNSIVFDSAIRSASNPLKPGEEGEITFIVTKAGEFNYICTVPGHAALGMQGEFIVNPAEGGAATGSAEKAEPTGVEQTFDLTFVESSDFRTLGFNAVAGSEGANPTIKVNAGDTVIINISHSGKMPHAFGIVSDPENPNSIVFDAALGSPNSPLTAGKSGQVKFVADRPGHYYYICTVPGHAALGMQGDFIVE